MIDIQKEYQKKCRELGLKQTRYRERPDNFSAIDAALCTPEAMEKIVHEKPDQAKKEEGGVVLIKRSLLQEILEKLSGVSDLSEVETVEELKREIL